MDSARQKLKDLIAWKVNERKLRDEEEFREFKRNEKDILEIQRHRMMKGRPRRRSKSKKEADRTFKLLSRGIPSYLYKNLNKAMM